VTLRSEKNLALLTRSSTTYCETSKPLLYCQHLVKLVHILCLLPHEVSVSDTGTGTVLVPLCQ